MRRLLATLLLVCFGMLIPTAASPMRVCLLEGKVHEPGFTSYGETASHKIKCCPDCGSTEEGDSCCQDVKKLPDVPAPSPPMILLPPVFFCEREFEFTVPPCPVADVANPFAPSKPIRGPDSPGARRAQLGIWTI